MSNAYFLAVILGSGIVTVIPRVVPFFLTRSMTFPKKLERFMSFIPVTILTALFIQSLLTYQAGEFPKIKGLELLACLPAFFIRVKTNSLLKIVLTGVATIALLRFFLS